MQAQGRQGINAPRKMYLKKGRLVSSRDSTSSLISFDSQIEKALPPKPASLASFMEGDDEPPHPADPRNWSRTKKELAFTSLAFALGISGSLKTLLVTVNAVISTQLNVSYAATTALTGVPLIIGALFGLKANTLARFIGKRGLLLVGSIVALLATLLNMHSSQYGAFMIARILQSVGWGTVEALVYSSVSDLYSEEEHGTRTMIFNLVNVAFAWGTPILGGYLSQNSEGFANQIMIVNIFQAFSVLFVILLVPETTFHSSSSSNTATPPTSKARRYLQSLKLTTSHSTQKFSFQEAMKPLRAMGTPSAIITTILSAPLLGAAWGIASTISLLFSAMPTFLFPSRLGFLFTAPLLFGLFFTAVSFFLVRKASDSTSMVGGQVASLFVGVAGLLAFGAYVSGKLMPQMDGNGNAIVGLLGQALTLSLPTVSAIFGLLVGGAVALSYSSSASLCLDMTENKSEKEVMKEVRAAGMVWQEIILGLFVIFTPMAVKAEGEDIMLSGLKDTCIGLAIVGLVVASTVMAGLWVKGEVIRRIDMKVMGQRGVREGRV